MAYTPRIVNSWLTEPYKGYPGQVRYHNRNWAGIQGIVIHVQEGNNNGTKQHFRVVKASSTVLIAKDGLIERLVPENKAPWTNGDVRNPDSQIRALMNKYGPDPNTWTLTIECEGFSGGLPYTEAQYQSILWQVRDWRNRYGKVPVLAHRQINSVTRSTCPEAPGGPLLPRLYRDLETPAPAAFKPGDAVRFTANLNLRRAWTTADTYNGKPNVIKTMPEGTIATIIAGPNHRDGYEWMDVSIDGFGTGHVASNWLEKIDDPGPEPVPEGRTFTTRFDLLFRDTVGFWNYEEDRSNVVETIPAGTTGRVTEGPMEADGVNWLKVHIDDLGDGYIQTEVLNTVQVHDD